MVFEREAALSGNINTVLQPLDLCLVGSVAKLKAMVTAHVKSQAVIS